MKKINIYILALILLKVGYAQEKSSLKWWNPAHNEFPVVSGQAWPEEVGGFYHRLPARAEKDLRKAVWHLSKHSAGLSIRFWSNASNIHVKYKLTGEVSMPHMPATGVSGLDLYSKSYDGEWLRSWGSYVLDSLSNYTFRIDDPSNTYKKHGREYQLFLPLYNEVDSLEIGISEASFLNVLPIRKEKPIVAYGTSICQGACATRPGMAWTNILERKLERPVINLGFSGNGRLEPELIDLMTEIDAKIYILDCLPNLNPIKDDTYQLTLNAVRQLRAKRPEAPIILTAHIGYAEGWTNKKSNDTYLALNKALDSAFHSLKKEGVSKIHRIKKEEIGLNFDSYVDYIHPNDIGMLQYANAYEKQIREILDQPKGNISITIPKTQSRDISVYKWEERHQKILELNKVDPPRILLFGNSIAHFWGGTPRTSIINGNDSWEQVMKPLGVRNFGFGWDRIENVLWRVYHDELDGFESEKIILMLGTNNLHLNNEHEIITGLERLIKAIRTRQPKSSLLLIGILPRSGKEKQVHQINLKIAQLAVQENINFKNIGAPLLLKNGRINEALFSDGLHPNKKGYKIMAKSLKALLIKHK